MAEIVPADYPTRHTVITAERVHVRMFLSDATAQHGTLEKTSVTAPLPSNDRAEEALHQAVTEL